VAEPYNVLFLCTGNSARSVMAEAILNKVGAGKFRAYSAGSQPKGHVHPETLRLLQTLGYDTSGFRSKSWHEFAKRGAPPLDFAFTVCDSAAGETCPVWPGQPMTAHWGVPDPADPLWQVSMHVRSHFRFFLVLNWLSLDHLVEKLYNTSALPLHPLGRLFVDCL
jgi:protein-tyrosine-phosphatase